MTTELTADVVVVGAGPAGAATALMLAPFHRTLLLDRAGTSVALPPAGRIGESLPAAARRLLRDMGLWEDFQAQGHAPCYGTSSLWGGPEATFATSVHDPDGSGWHLDRAHFDDWLRRWASRRGTALVAPAKLTGATATEDGWRLSVTRRGRALTIATRFVVDAGGRAAPLVKALGHRRDKLDRLVCRWLHGTAAGDRGFTRVAAEPDGWWYTAALPAGRRVLAFHTDADQPCARETTEASGLLQRARRQTEIVSLLDTVRFEPLAPAGRCAAHSSVAATSAGAGWLAVGDAALCCDPLSSQGLLNALYLALKAAAAVERALGGDVGAIEDYQNVVDRVAVAYRSHLSAWYALETRWVDRPFWARRTPAACPGALDQLTPPRVSSGTAARSAPSPRTRRPA